MNSSRQGDKRRKDPGSAFALSLSLPARLAIRAYGRTEPSKSSFIVVITIRRTVRDRSITLKLVDPLPRHHPQLNLPTGCRLMPLHLLFIQATPKAEREPSSAPFPNVPGPIVFDKIRQRIKTWPGYVGNAEGEYDYQGESKEEEPKGKPICETIVC